MNPIWFAIFAALGLALVFFLAASLRNLPRITPILALMVAFVGMISQNDLGVRINNVWVAPIQDYRAELIFLMVLFIALAVFANSSKVSLGHLAPPVLLLLAIQCYAGLLRMVHETPVAGIQTIVFALLVQVPIALCIASVIEQDGGPERVFRALGFGVVIWLGAVIIQFGINPAEMNPRAGGRFTGLSGGPQQLAVYLGPMTALLLWLGLNDPKRSLAPLWLAATGFGAICLLLSGSRTGVALFVLGSIGVLYARIGRAVVLMPFAAIFGYLGLQLLERLELTGAKRLVSGTDTRSEAWNRLIETAVENPLIGVGFYRLTANENSYLIAIAAYGIGMLIIVLALLATWCLLALKLFTVRAWLTPFQRRVADLVFAYTAMYFAGAFFEWYIIARLDNNLFVAIAITTTMMWLLRQAHANRVAHDHAQLEAFYSDGETEGPNPDDPDHDPAPPADEPDQLPPQGRLAGNA